MKDVVKQFWEAYAPVLLQTSRHKIAVQYTDGYTEDELQLIGPVKGKRVLEIGCGGAQCSIAFARQGARVTGIDVAQAQIEIATQLCAENGVEVDLLQGDMSDLSRIASGSQDVVFSVSAIGYVPDLDVCFKEVYRVLKSQGILVIADGHPFSRVIAEKEEHESYEFEGYDDVCNRFLNSYWDTGPKISGEPGAQFAQFDRTIGDYVRDIVGAGLVVEDVIEPQSTLRPPPRPSWYKNTQARLDKVPQTIVIKSRKP